MKKLLIPIIFITILSSCIDYSTKTESKVNKQRIIGREYTAYEGYGYQIIEIDGIEYIANGHGGIYPLVKNPQPVTTNQ